MVRLVLLGPPGVGKGTQGRRLAADHRWALISTGEMLRDAATRGTTLGLEARKRMDEGLLVPDDVMIGLVRERSGERDAGEGFVLDGFPRTVAQADALDSMLQARSQRLDVALALAAPEDELVRRLGARRECPVCKRSYNQVSAPARDGEHCDDHPDARLVQRPDDREDTIRKRLEIYRRETAPLLDYYRGQGRLHEVQGAGPADEVYRELVRTLNGVGTKGTKGTKSWST